MAQYPDLSITKPKSTNLSLTVAFNKVKVHQFFFPIYKELLQSVPNKAPA